MSKEMREQIDRVKNWKQFLNENVDELSNISMFCQFVFQYRKTFLTW